MKRKILYALSISVMLFTQTSKAQINYGFDKIPLNANSYYNASDTGVGFSEGHVFVPTIYDSNFMYWSGGFALSNVKDSVTSGYSNLYASKANGGFESPNYLVGQQDAEIKFNDNLSIFYTRRAKLKSIQITNSTYSANSMRDGDGFAKKFGGASGNDADYFYLVIRGVKQNNALTTDSIVFYLSDFRSTDNSEDYIVTDWTNVNLSTLYTNYIELFGLHFTLRSSDVGQFGINTPLFYCIDNIEFEDVEMTYGTTTSLEEYSLSINSYINYESTGWFGSSPFFFNNQYDNTFDYWSAGWAVSNVKDSITSGFVNMYASASGSGQAQSDNYLVGQQNAVLFTTYEIDGFYINNSTYAYKSMELGDAFAKKFGGASGNDPDYFKLTISGYANGVTTQDTIEVYLADFRFVNNEQDYILNDWIWVDVSKITTGLNYTDTLIFKLSSSDVGQFGYNTPLFFCADNFKSGDFLWGSTKKLSVMESIGLVPNPAKEFLAVSVGGSDVFSHEILSIDGKTVLVSCENNINVSELPQGSYFVKTTTSKKVITTKFIKE